PNAARRSPKLSHLKGRSNFLSLDAATPKAPKKAKKNAANPYKTNHNASNDDNRKQHSRSNRSKVPSKFAAMFNATYQIPAEDLDDGNDSGSSGDIILPAITVPKNYDGNISSIQTQHQPQATTSLAFPEVVKICIDSPSE